MNGPGHERVVPRLVAEDDEFCCPETALVAGFLRQFLHRPADHIQGVHIDALLAAADIDRGADLVGNRQGLGDGGDIFPVGCRHPLFHLGRETAEDVHPDQSCGAIQGLCEFDKIACDQIRRRRRRWG